MFKLLEIQKLGTSPLYIQYSCQIAQCTYSAGISKQSKRARNRVGIGLLYRLARLQLAELIPGSLKV